MTFGKKIRETQARFRDTSPTISARARQPDENDAKGQRNPHLLAHGHEMENLFPGIAGAEQAMRFFADRKIKWWKSARSGDDFSRDGPTRNMASSQVFCVNFWYPIMEDEGLLTALVRSIEPGVDRVVEISSTGREEGQKLKSLVEFEWVGSKETLEKKTYSRGANATSIDAFVSGIAKGRRIGFFFEWKLVEEYREHYLGRGSPGMTRRETYRPYLAASRSVFSREIPLDAVLYEPFYQIFRMGLLGQKMIYEDDELDQVYVIPVYPRNNLAFSRRITSPWLKEKYGSDKTVSEIAAHFFTQPVIFRSIYADELWRTVKQHARSPACNDWLEYMDARYFRNGV